MGLFNNVVIYREWSDICLHWSQLDKRTCTDRRWYQSDKYHHSNREMRHKDWLRRTKWHDNICMFKWAKEISQLRVYNTWVLIKSKVWTNNTSVFSALLILEWMIPCSFLLFKGGLIVKLMVKSCAIIVSSKRQHRKQQQKATNSIRQI